MTQYAKLTADGQLDLLRFIPNVANPKEDMWDAYAKKHGYKPYFAAPAPCPYYSKVYKETEEVIEDEWNPWELPKAQESALATVQMELDAARQQRVTVPCDGLPNGIFCDPEARMMATGLVAMGAHVPAGMTWTDAADEVHELTPELLGAISAAFVGYLLGIQHTADGKRKLINEATNVDDIWAVVAPTPPEPEMEEEAPEEEEEEVTEDETDAVEEGTGPETEEDGTEDGTEEVVEEDNTKEEL